jgi:YfiH family protein
MTSAPVPPDRVPWGTVPPKHTQLPGLEKDRPFWYYLETLTASKRLYLTVPSFEPIPGLVHGFGSGRWSDADFLDFAASKGLTPVIMRQLHSDVVHRLEAAPEKGLEGDALMTNIPGLLLVVRTADCLPVLLVDAANRAMAAVHCGWRGTAKRILEKAVRAMGEAYGSKAGEMLAAMGPCIGAACYEVGPEVREAFLRAGFPPAVFVERGHLPAIQVPGHRAKYLLDLKAANAWLLDGLDFKKANVFDAGPACTHCEPSLLSHRRHPADLRRMHNFVGFMR